MCRVVVSGHRDDESISVTSEFTRLRTTHMWHTY